MSKPLLAINHLSVNFILYTHTTPAIENIHFAVSKGEWVAIVGESGSGKNTFKKNMQIISIETGTIYFKGMNLAQLTSPKKHWRKDIRRFFKTLLLH
ncbi:ATP-binding cassette domain-containing protein [Hydrotalea sp.]|uniref:ATP-binding cassette domain-containing protein n=1 Tax=Hydrotalea sp. TaxID=2881279 RepID=UPI0026194A95|nr:ATP-binding cassette domain-containing protein [Hydrotalea sp.]